MGRSMASGVASEHPMARMRTTVLSMQADRDSAPRAVRELPRRRTSFDDIAVVVCFLVLIGIVVLGGALMLLSWITATVPVSPRVACSEVDGCAATASEKKAPVLADDDWVHGPALTR